MNPNINIIKNTYKKFNTNMRRVEKKSKRRLSIHDIN